MCINENIVDKENYVYKYCSNKSYNSLNKIFKIRINEILTIKFKKNIKLNSKKANDNIFTKPLSYTVIYIVTE